MNHLLMGYTNKKRKEVCATNENIYREDEEFSNHISEIIAKMYTIQELTDIMTMTREDVLDRISDQQDELSEELSNLRDMRDELEKLPDLEERLRNDRYFRQSYNDMIQMIEQWEEVLS